VRIGHLANGKINQSFPGISESLEGHGFGSHSEKAASKLGF
jgi:predicted GNAT family acetyltransferase